MSEEDKHKEDEQTRGDGGDGQPDQSPSNRETPVDDNAANAEDFATPNPSHTTDPPTTDDLPADVDGEKELEDVKADHEGHSDIQPSHEQASTDLTQDNHLDQQNAVHEAAEPRQSTDLEPEPKDVTPSQPLPSTILSPVPPLQTNTLPIDPAEALALLQAQIKAVEEQRDQLNSKLVKSLERCADLEDEVFHANDSRKEKEQKILQLEEERKEHLHALDTGLLVEEANVKNEMQRLATSLAEAQGKRELAEEGKRTVENEVDDLAASLFSQANSMVATERLARSKAETRLKEAEDNLSVAESVVREMQQAMQDLHHASKSRGITTSASMNSLIAHTNVPRPLRTSHLPYNEFLLFVSHIRSLRPLTPAGTTSTLAPLPPPALTTLISQPLLARLIAEDHDPALRLDFAPGVGWMAKKGITNAIIEGMLMVEPVSSSTIFAVKPESDIVCALSGKTIASAPSATHGSVDVGLLALAGGGGLLASSSSAPPQHPSSKSSTSRFFSRASAISRPTSPTSPANLPPPSPTDQPSTTFIFRIAPPSNTPLSEAKPTTLYPVENGWSLDRLRATCELWRFVRTGILNPVWSYEDGTERPPAPVPPPPPAGHTSTGGGGQDGHAPALPARGGAKDPKPELPPRKKSWGLSGWGLGRSSSSTATDKVPTSVMSPPKVPPRRLPPAVGRPSKEHKEVVELAPDLVDSVQEDSKGKDKVGEEASTDEVPPPSSLEVEITPPVTEVAPLSDAVSDEPTPVEQEPAATESEPSAEAVDVSGEQASPNPGGDSGAESEAFQTPTEESDRPPLEKELEDKESEEKDLEEKEVEEKEKEAEQVEVDEGTDEMPEDENKKVSKDEVDGPPPSSPSTLEPPTPTEASPPSTTDTSVALASPTIPPGAPPPLPRRAAARRPVPAPPSSGAATPQSATTATTEPATEVVLPSSPNPETKPDLPPRPSLDAPADPPITNSDAPSTSLEDKSTREAEDTASPLSTTPGPTKEDWERKRREWEESAWRELSVIREKLFWTRVGEESD